MSKKTIAIFTAPEGHESIAEAVTEILEKKYRVKSLMQRDPLFSVYVPLYQNFPGIFKIPYKISTYKKNLNPARKIFLSRYLDSIKKFIKKSNPDLFINVHWMYNSSLEKIQTQTQIPLINILTDPLTIHPLLVAPKAKFNLVFDKTGQKAAQKYHLKAKYLNSGWFVRNKFEEKYNQNQIRKKLKLDQNKLTFLIASGSEGTNLVLKVLPILLFASQPIQIIIACGNNKTLYKSIQGLQNLLKKTDRYNTLIPLKFTPNIHHYMQAADLVIGKAGPNMLFEAVATETPFFAITHISGQEDGNLEIIRDYNLGYVEENILKAQKLLKQILDNPAQLNKFKPDLIKLKKYNQQAKKKLCKIVAKLI